VLWLGVNYWDEVEDLTGRGGADAEQPHRMRYRSLHA